MVWWENRRRVNTDLKKTVWSESIVCERDERGSVKRDERNKFVGEASENPSFATVSLAP